MDSESRHRRPFAVLLLVVAACSGDTVDTTAPDTTLPATALAEADEPMSEPTTTTTDTLPVDPMYRWEVGDCLSFEVSDDLPYEPFGTASLAMCNEPHTHQVYFTGNFPGDEGADYPETIDTDIREICTDAFVDFLGVLPVESQLDILMYLPDEEEWGEGLRYQACVAYLPAGVETYRELTGSLDGIGPDFLLQVSPGTCFPAVYVKLSPVDCASTHQAEVVGTITHPAEPGAPYPGQSELEFFALSECNTLAGDYVVEGSVGVAAFTRAFSQLEWEAGWRDLTCLAFAFEPGGEIVRVRGSFAEPGWTVVTGQQQA